MDPVVLEPSRNAEQASAAQLEVSVVLLPSTAVQVARLALVSVVPLLVDGSLATTMVVLPSPLELLVGFASENRGEEGGVGGLIVRETFVRY